MEENKETQEPQVAEEQVQEAAEAPVAEASVVEEATDATVVEETAEEATEPKGRNLRKERVGIVVSNKMEKSISVAVKYKEKHPMYGKFVNKTSKFLAHDEKQDANIGDVVRIMETRPLSKRKRWRLVEIVERAK